MKQQVFIIEDDPIMQECIARAVLNGRSQHFIKFHYFSNAIAAIEELNQAVPDLIFLDILLNGPDGFSFLNELISYEDTNKIPIVLITSLEISQRSLSQYNIVEVLQKETMSPTEIANITDRILINV